MFAIENSEMFFVDEFHTPNLKSSLKIIKKIIITILIRVSLPIFYSEFYI